MVTRAATLEVYVGANTKDAETGLSNLGQKVGSVGGTLATAFGTAAVAGVAALGAAFVASVSSAAGFESKMSEVKAVSGATAEEMKSLSGLALQLGKDTSFSASEAAEGIGELVKGGLSIPDIMNGAATATLNLAAAGGVSLKDAATIAANALAEFNLKGEDMGHVADLIAGAANASALDVGDFKFSLSAAGAVASTVGFSFDDLAQGIAVMGQAGIKGSDAGTSLKTMMLNLQPHTKAQVEEFRRLGLETTNVQGAYDSLVKMGIQPASNSLADVQNAMTNYLGMGADVSKWTKSQRDDFEKLEHQTGFLSSAFFDANGKVKSMSEVAGVLKHATEGMTEAQKLNTLQTLFGSDAIRAGAVLAKAGAEGFNEMAESMGKVTAAEVGATKLDNLSGSFEQLKGSIETLGITFGLAFLPVLKGATDGVTGFVNVLIPIAEEWGPKIAAGLGVAIDAIKGVAGAIGAALGGTDWGGAQAAVAEVGGFLVEQFGKVVTWFGDNWPLIQQTFSTVVGAIESFWHAHGETILTVIGLAWDTLKTVIGTALDVILGLIRIDMQLINGDWSGAWGTMKGLVVEVVGAIGHILGNDLKAAFAVIDDITGGALTTIGTWVDNVGTTLSTAWGVIKGVAQVAWDVHAGIAGLVVSAIGDMVSGADATLNTAGTGLVALVSAAWDAIKSAASTAWSAAGGIVEAIGSAWDAIKTGTADALTSAPDAITATVAAGWDAVKTGIDTVFGAGTGDTITGLIATGWENVKSNTKLLMEDPAAGVLNILKNDWDLVKTGLDTVFGAGTGDTITGVIAAGWSAISKGASDLMNDPATGVKQVLSVAWGAVKTTIDTVFGAGTGDTITGVIASGWTAISTATDNLFGEGKGVRKLFSDAMGVMKAAVDPVVKILSGDDGTGGLIGFINKLKEIMPEWLIPHSPTPFEMGLRGIMKAAQAMDSAFGNMGGGLEGIAQIAALATSIGGVDFGKAAAAISASETGGGANLHEIGGTGAVGPFMFDPGGELKNFARDLHVPLAEAARIAAAEPMKAAAWALHGYLGTALRAGLEEGLSGAALAMFGSRYGQRPAGDNWKKAGEWYQQLYPGLADGAIIRARPGGVMALLGEGDHDEVVAQLPRGWDTRRNGSLSGSGGDTVINVTVNFQGSPLVNKREIEDVVVVALNEAVKRQRLSPTVLR